MSYFYESLQSVNPPSTVTVKTAWEDELGIQIPDETWEESLKGINAGSINSRHCLIRLCVIHRLHYSQSNLHKIFPDVSSQCDKCNITEGNVIHSFALCPEIEKYWTIFFKTFSHILNIHIEPDPVLIVLGTSDVTSVLRKYKQQLLSYGLITSKK